jgi:hypothetical protein
VTLALDVESGGKEARDDRPIMGSIAQFACEAGRRALPRDRRWKERPGLAAGGPLWDNRPSRGDNTWGECADAGARDAGVADREP